MKVSYFPGCTLKTKAKDLEEYALKSASVLGVEMEEIENWQCCGGAFTTSSDEIATKLSSIRALESAKKKGQVLVSVCSACHNVLKQTNNAIKVNLDFKEKANNYLKSEDIEYNGETEVMHFLELLRDKVGYENVKEKVVKPLKDLKVCCYYGCLLLRPSKVMQMDDAENPSIMEDLVRALGAEPKYFGFRNECCGGYTVMDERGDAKGKSKLILDSAKKAGADVIVTACPLCLYNLKKNQDGVKVVYFTELLAEALGVKE